ncbi:MAG: hypothetical protein ACRDQ1_20040, partial [Sciscionella sp.]
MERATPMAMGCFGTIVIFLLAVTASSACYAAGVFGAPGAPFTPQRVVAIVVTVLFGVLLALLVVVLARSLRLHRLLAVDAKGIVFGDGSTSWRLAWGECSAVSLLHGEGPRRAGSGNPLLRLTPVRAELITGTAALRERI